MKKTVFIIALLAILCLLQAEVNGSKGFQMLRIMIDPVTAGQGGNGVINSTSGFTYLDNAAAPLLQKGTVLSVSQNIWLFDTSLSNIGYRNNMGRSSFGYAMRFLDYGKIDNRDDIGQIVGEYHPMDLTVTFNYGIRLMASHYLGANLTGLYEKIDDSSSTGISCDLGYIYLTPIKDLRLLASLKNFGTTSKMDSENIELPLTAEIGLSRDFDLKDNRLSADIKLIKDIDNDELKGSIGLEANLYNNFFIRTGYKLGYDLESFSCGFGVQVKWFMIDYAYNPISESLDDVHILGLSYHF